MNRAWNWVSPRLRSVEVLVALFVLTVLVAGIGATTFALLRSAERDILAARRESELAEGVRTATLLSRRVVDLQRALVSTAALLDAETLHRQDRLDNFLLSKPVLRGMFAVVFVADGLGHFRGAMDANGPRHERLEIGHRDYFRKAVREQRVVVSDPMPGRFSGENIVIIAAPVRAAGGVIGVIGGSLRLQSKDLLEDLVDAPESGSGLRVVVTDSQGHILAHPDRERVMQSIATEPGFVQGYAEWLSAGGAAGGAVEPAGLFLHQPGQLLSVSGVPGPDWLVWRALPEADLLAPLDGARRSALQFAAAVVAAASLLILFITRHLLHPLTELKDRARYLFDGSKEVHEGWPAGRGEIGELSRVLRHVAAERAQLETFNAMVMAKLDSVMAAAPLGIMFTRDRLFEVVNAEACRLLGRTQEELLGKEARSIYASNEDYDTLGPQVGTAFAQGQPYEGEWQFIRADQGTFWGQLRGQPVEPGNPKAGTIWTLADITEQVASRKALQWSATHDTLTGLPNRKLFEQRAQRVLNERPETLPAAIVMIDLDRFKPINDSDGHAAGDAMLCAVAAAIASRTRSSDLVARIGGDEFVLLLEKCGPEAAARVALSVQAAIVNAAVSWEGHLLQVGASLGVAQLGASTATLAQWLQEADAACYEAKAAGRGTVRHAAVLDGDAAAASAAGAEAQRSAALAQTSTQTVDPETVQA